MLERSCLGSRSCQGEGGRSSFSWGLEGEGSWLVFLAVSGGRAQRPEATSAGIPLRAVAPPVPTGCFTASGELDVFGGASGAGALYIFHHPVIGSGPEKEG